MNWIRRRWIWIVLAAIVVLVVVAAALLVAYLVLRRQQPSVRAWQDPIAAVAPGQVSAAWALNSLAGVTELLTIDAAIDNGELHTAYAALVFSPDVPDRQRVGRLSALAEAFARAGEVELASVCYQQMYDLAVLSPRLSEPLRAEALQAAGEGLARAGQKEQALGAYEQVYRLAIEGSHLHLAQRRELLDLLYGAYVGLGDGQRAQDARTRMVQLDQEAEGRSAAGPRWPELPSGDSAISTAEIGALEEARRQAAYEVVNALGQGSEIPAASVSRLSEALQAEDATKMSWYRQELGSTTEPGRTIDLEWQVIRWLLLKYRVSKGGFGVSLVREWEADVVSIESELATAYGELLYAYEELMTALPNASLVAPGKYEARCLVVLAGRLGLCPGYPAETMAEALDGIGSIVAELVEAGYSDGLYVVVGEPTGTTGLWLRRGGDLAQPAETP